MPKARPDAMQSPGWPTLFFVGTEKSACVSQCDQSGRGLRYSAHFIACTDIIQL